MNSFADEPPLAPLKVQIRENIQISDILCPNPDHVLTMRSNEKLACVTFENALKLDWYMLHQTVLAAYEFRKDTCDNTLTQNELEKYPHFKTLANNWIENIDSTYRPYLILHPDEVKEYEHIMQNENGIINPKCFGSEYFTFPLVLSFEMGGPQLLDFGDTRKIN